MVLYCSFLYGRSSAMADKNMSNAIIWMSRNKTKLVVADMVQNDPIRNMK